VSKVVARDREFNTDIDFLLSLVISLSELFAAHTRVLVCAKQQQAFFLDLVSCRLVRREA